MRPRSRTIYTNGSFEGLGGDLPDDNLVAGKGHRDLGNGMYYCQDVISYEAECQTTLEVVGGHEPRPKLCPPKGLLLKSHPFGALQPSVRPPNPGCRILLCLGLRLEAEAGNDSRWCNHLL